eukprot:3594991-Rhodomonas_salina.1
MGRRIPGLWTLPRVAGHCKLQCTKPCFQSKLSQECGFLNLSLQCNVGDLRASSACVPARSHAAAPPHLPPSQS